MSSSPAPALPRRDLLAAGLSLWPVLLASARPVSRLISPAAGPGRSAAAPGPAVASLPDPPANLKPMPTPSRATVAGVGVNLAGAEFGVESPTFSHTNPGEPGRDYTYPSPAAIGDVATAGVPFVRLPVRWERLQPDPGDSLNPAELARLRTALDRLHAAGLAAIVDLHNYARFALATPTGVRRVLIDEIVRDANGRRTAPASRERFANFWTRLAGALAGHPAVAGWGLMNEPHDLAPHGREFTHGARCDWRAVSRLAADAVRAADPGAAVFVAGASWSSSERWSAANGPEPWIDGPGVIYEAHCYLDADAAGKYSSSYQAEAAADRGIADRAKRRLAPFLNWCDRTGSRGFLGECGVPPADAGWLAVWGSLLSELTAAETPGCLWAAGEWWGDYALNVHPTGGVAGPVLRTALAG